MRQNIRHQLCAYLTEHKSLRAFTFLCTVIRLWIGGKKRISCSYILTRDLEKTM